MNTVRSNVYMLPPKEHRTGECAVCEQPAILRFRDASTGALVGSCCSRELVLAEAGLYGVTGLRAPTIEESTSVIPNH